MESRVSTLILSDGGLGSLVACALAREATLTKDGASAGEAIVAAFDITGYAGMTGAQEKAMREAARAMADHYGFSCVESVGIEAMAQVSAARFSGERELNALERAAFFAVENGISRVVWPVSACVGESYDLDAIAKAHERAIVVSKLVALESAAHGVPSITIDTPMLDMTDRQLADLAVDLGVPVELCGWWGESAQSPARARWMQALEAVGAGFAAGQ